MVAGAGVSFVVSGSASVIVPAMVPRLCVLTLRPYSRVYFVVTQSQ